MEYFWMQQDDIPPEMGYPLFGAAHLISVAVTLSLVAIALFTLRKKSGRVQRRVLKAIPLVMLVLELAKDLFLFSIHKFGLGYLPFHVCSIGIFVFLLREFLPLKWAKAYFGEVAYALIMPASLVALVFADWTIYYPVLNFINLHSYLWHGLLVLYPALLFMSKEISPSIRHIHWVLLFLCLVVPPIYLFDKRFNCNYFFVNWPIPNSPLSFLASFMGKPGYLIGYAILTILVLLLVYKMIPRLRP